MAISREQDQCSRGKQPEGVQHGDARGTAGPVIVFNVDRLRRPSTPAWHASCLEPLWAMVEPCIGLGLDRILGFRGFLVGSV